jgi:hypothetical protein
MATHHSKCAGDALSLTSNKYSQFGYLSMRDAHKHAGEQQQFAGGIAGQCVRSWSDGVHGR